jgi:hypothetical protein
MSESEGPHLTGEHVILEWRGLKITLAVARLFTGFWLTILIGAGCFTVLLSSDKPAEEQAAIAILSSVVTAWIAVLTRN